MSFYYGKEKKAFDADWKKLRKEYEEAGMSEQAIQAMYEYDWEWFCSSRKFINPTEPLSMVFTDNESCEISNNYIRKYSELSVEFSETHLSDLLGWMEDIDDAELLECLQQLGEKNLMILTLHTQYGFSQKNIADFYNCKQASICARLLKIKNFLNLSIKNGFPMPTI